MKIYFVFITLLFCKFWFHLWWTHINFKKITVNWWKPFQSHFQRNHTITLECMSILSTFIREIQVNPFALEQWLNILITAISEWLFCRKIHRLWRDSGSDGNNDNNNNILCILSISFVFVGMFCIIWQLNGSLSFRQLFAVIRKVSVHDFF